MTSAPQPATAVLSHRRRYQKGSLIRRGPSWIGRWKEDELRGPLLELKRVYRCVRLGAVAEMTKQQAQRELSVRISSITPIAASLTFAELYKIWCVENRPRYKASTWTMIESMTRRHLMPKFGTAPASKIGSAEINAFSRELIGRRYDPYTVRNIVLALKVVLESTGNEIKGIVFPLETSIKERRPFTVEEMKQVIVAIDDPQVRIIARIAAETGLRIGEILALGWLDFSGTYLSVKGTLYRGEVQPPKTKCGKRVVRISDFLYQLIQNFSTEYQENGDRTNVWRTRIFSVTYNQTLKSVKRALISCGFNEPGLGMHSFRHGNATLLDSLNAPLRIRMDRLGHSRSDTTLGIYTGTTPADEKRIAEEIGAALS